MCVCGHMCFVSLYLSVHVFVCEKVGVCVSVGGGGGGGWYTGMCMCYSKSNIKRISHTHT